jgi:hypothetical protein
MKFFEIMTNRQLPSEMRMTSLREQEVLLEVAEIQSGKKASAIQDA